MGMDENQPPPYPPGIYATPRPWLPPTPVGARYDHLARNAVNSWWRPIVGTLLAGLGFALISALVLVLGTVVALAAGVPVLGLATRPFGDPVFGLAVLLLSIAATLPMVYGVAVLVQRRRPGTLSSVAGRIRWSWLWQCVGVAMVAMLLGQGALYLAYVVTGVDTGDLFGWAGWARFLPALVVILLLVPFQAAAEEYLFRGWVLQAFGAYLNSPWPGIVLGTGGFVALHGYTDWGMADVFAFGALMGWLTIRTGGLEAAIAMHVVNNVAAFGLLAAAGEIDKAMEQGSVPWQSLAGTVVQLSVFAVGVFFLAKKRAVRTISG